VDSPLLARFCSECGAEFEAAVPRDVRKTVTIVFCDLVGSTRLGERVDPESLQEVLDRYFDEMTDVLERHGGAVEKYIGDAIMTVFGIPRTHEDDAIRATRAAWEMRAALQGLNEELQRKWGVRLESRTGVNTGEVVVGDLTSRQRLVTGDAVNVAARLEQSAPQGEVLLGAETELLVRPWVDARAVTPLTLKGKSEEVPAYQLLGVHDALKPLGMPRRGFVGRPEELRSLELLFDQTVSERKPQLITIVAGPGIGKSRLVAEFVTTVQAKSRALVGRCPSYGEGAAFRPVVEIIRQAADLDETLEPTEAFDRLRAPFEGRPEREMVVARLAALVGLSNSVFPVMESFWAVRKLLERLAHSRPLLIVIEDLHWADPAMFALLSHVLDNATAVPLLIVATAREDLVEEQNEWLASSTSQILELESLPAEESHRLMDEVLGGSSLDTLKRNQIADMAAGNPLFIEQIIGMMLEDDGETSIRTGSVTIPPTIEALLNDRLDRLKAGEQRAAQAASIAGRIFYRRAVAELLAQPSLEVDENIHDLEHRRLVQRGESLFPGEDAFGFRHILIRDAAYARTLKRTRADWHERFADWLGAIAEREEWDEVLGHHLEQAHRYLVELGPVDEHGQLLGLRASEHLASAGRRALEAGNVATASNLLARAVVLTPPNRDRFDALLDRFEAVMLQGRYEEAREVIEESTAVARGLNDPLLSARAELAEMWLRTMSSEGKWAFSEEIPGRVRDLMPALEEAEYHEALTLGWRLLAKVGWSRAQAQASDDADRRSLVHARMIGDRRTEQSILAGRAASALCGPMPAEEGARLCRRLLEDCKSNQAKSAFILSRLGGLVAMNGDLAEGRRMCHEARITLRDVGAIVPALAVSQVMGGLIEILAGDPQGAEKELRPDCEEMKAIGDRWDLPTSIAMLGRALVREGKLDEAEECAVLSRDTTVEDDLVSQLLWRQVSAVVSARRGDTETGKRLAREAVEIADATDFLNQQADAYLDLADVLGLDGRHEEAAGARGRALWAFERKGNVVGARNVRRLLGPSV
jgi:class 3 adenylate cyclase/tetratricopeptide (TPR) repeat protein